MEVLGTYDPIPKHLPGANKGDRKSKEIKVDVNRAKYWLGVGAQPSNTVWRLLAMVFISCCIEWGSVNVYSDWSIGTEVSTYWPADGECSQGYEVSYA